MGKPAPLPSGTSGTSPPWNLNLFAPDTLQRNRGTASLQGIRGRLAQGPIKKFKAIRPVLFSRSRSQPISRTDVNYKAFLTKIGHMKLRISYLSSRVRLSIRVWTRRQHGKTPPPLALSGSSLRTETKSSRDPGMEFALIWPITFYKLPTSPPSPLVGWIVLQFLPS